jgi:hypothetical protein
MASQNYYYHVLENAFCSPRGVSLAVASLIPLGRHLGPSLRSRQSSQPRRLCKNGRNILQQRVNMGRIHFSVSSFKRADHQAQREVNLHLRGTRQRIGLCRRLGARSQKRRHQHDASHRVRFRTAARSWSHGTERRNQQVTKTRRNRNNFF